MSGIIPDSVLKSFYQKKIKDEILPRNVHLDKKSVEKETNVVKPKYKLLTRRNLDLGIFLFYALTSSEDACPRRARVSISDYEYEEKNNRHIRGGISYINLEKVAVEDEQDIILKMRDRGNNFEYIGKITQLKMNEIKSFSVSIRSSLTLSDEVKEVILGALYDADITEKFVSHFNI